jgi:putative hemolysin
MPADFLACVKNGGKVRTKELSGGKYIHICKDKNGKWHKGEVKTKKK